MVDAGRGRRPHQGDDGAGHVGGPGGLPVLVVHHVHGGPLPLAPDHRAHEVRPVRAVQPGGPEHVAVRGKLPEHGPLPGQLGAPVGGPRAGGVALRVGPRGVPGEHVVGGDVHQAGAGSRAGTGEVRRAVPVHGQRLALVGLRVVHPGPGRAVHHDIRPVLAQCRADRGPVGDVELPAAQAGRLLTGLLQGGEQVPAEHPTRAGDDPPGHGPAAGVSGAGWPFSGCHHQRLSRYQSTVARRPSVKGIRGA